MFSRILQGLVQQPPIDARRLVRDRDDERLLHVVLVLDLPDDLLDQVLDRHEARRATVLVEHDRDVDAPTLEALEEVVDGDRLGHEQRGAQQAADRGRAVVADEEGQQVLRIEDADDVVDVAVVDRDARMALTHDRLDVRAEVGIERERDHVDARDHDDAVWAVPDEDPGNKGGFRAIVAIADVSFYVRPDGALDREARRRGNSVYFPDRVVPMLPETLSAGVCSLKAGEDRAAMACHLVIDRHGKVTSWRFARALVRLRANIAYEHAQAAYDANEPREEWDAEVLPALRNLWASWALLSKARAARDPLDLDLPERQVILDDKGGIAEIRVRERLDAHRLIEDYMIAANVAAAKALEAKKSPVMYRIHEPPSREKLVSLKDYLETFEQSFALGQVITPAVFNRLIDGFSGDDRLPEIMEAILRSQTQAYYGPANAGHFGLALGSYAHFTSPIRRYADLLVHRALVDSYRLEVPGKVRDLPARTGLGEADAKGLARIGEAISALERRAMEAERETVDRYVAAYLATKTGEIVVARITGVQPFGFFATVDGLGGDGLVPVSTLGSERFFYDEAARTLDSEHGRVSYSVGQRLELRLMEANPISGALRFELPDAPEGGFRNRPPRRDGLKRPGKGIGKDKAGKHMVGKRGRPAIIRHKGGKR